MRQKKGEEERSHLYWREAPQRVKVSVAVKKKSREKETNTMSTKIKDGAENGISVSGKLSQEGGEVEGRDEKNNYLEKL